jgi:hypothetical protein
LIGRFGLKLEAKSAECRRMVEDLLGVSIATAEAERRCPGC